MLAYVIRRLLFGVVLILLATIVSFTILRASPGEAGATDINPRLSKAYIEEQKRIFGLDRSPVMQYLNWLGIPHLIGMDEPPGLVSGNLGKSMMFKQDVGDVILSRVGATLLLNVVTILVTWLVAIPLGIYAAMHQYKLSDKVLSVVSFAGMSLPNFFLALLLLWIFAGWFQILPPGGLYGLDFDRMGFFAKIGDVAKHLAVPVAVLTVTALAGLQRITRGSMLEVLRQQYVTTARAKGLSEGKVIYKHALRNAVNPLVTLLGFEFAALFGGAALLEIVINYPGMGQLILAALQAKDQSLVMATFLIGSVMLVLGNLIAELLLAWVDPRVRYQ